MARQISVGIDIGTSEVRVVIAEEVLVQTALGNGQKENHHGRTIPKIIGTGLSESRGLHHGYITNPNEVTRAVSIAVKQAEKTAGIEVKRAFVSIGGIGLGGIATNGSTIVSRADLEITELDINKVQEAAETAIPHALALNKKIINSIPIEYKIDNKLVYGRVEGLKAQKLDAKVLFIMCLEHHIQDLIKVIEDAGIEVIDVVAAPIAASFVTLSKNQKKAGCLLADIGAETLSIIVFENNTPVSLEVFPIGGTDITNDIALGLKIPLEEAESIKRGSVTGTSYSKKKFDEIVSARLSDMFELIEAHLKKIGRNALLPAGIILTGGGSGMHTLREFAESALKLPSKIAEVHFGNPHPNTPHKPKDSTWAVAYGLAILGFNAEGEQRSIGIRGVEKMAIQGKKGIRVLLDWIAQFLP